MAPKKKDDFKLILPKNSQYIICYYKSLIKKLRSKGIFESPSIIDALIDKDQFEIQIYYNIGSTMPSTKKISECSRCHKPAPINSSFCPNCNMKKMLFNRSDLSTLCMNQRKYSNYHIMVDDIVIYKSMYERIASAFAIYVKNKLLEEFTD